MSQLTPQMVERITRILHFPLTTYIAKQLRDHGITSEDVNPYSSQVGLNEIYNALRSMENANLAFPISTSGQASVSPDHLPDVVSFLKGIGVDGYY